MGVLLASAGMSRVASFTSHTVPVLLASAGMIRCTRVWTASY